MLVAVEDLSQLDGHQQVTFQLVLFDQQHIPQLVEVRVRLKTQLNGFPRPSCLWSFALVSQELSKLLEVFLSSGWVFRVIGLVVK